jgi:hypothetical protein
LESTSIMEIMKDMKATGWQVRSMERGFIISVMGINLLETGSRESKSAEELCTLQMVVGLRESGEKTCPMDLESYFMPTGMCIMVEKNENNMTVKNRVYNFFIYIKGNYSCGIKEGDGIYVHKIGTKYEGSWRGDERNGEGKVLSNYE